MSTRAKAKFIEWVKVRAPEQYARIVQMKSRNLGALSVAAAQGQASTNPGWIESIFSSLEKAMPAIIGSYQAKELVDLNIKRAKAGLDPIDSTGIAPQVNIGLPSNMRLILWAGLAVGALYLLRRK